MSEKIEPFNLLAEIEAHRTRAKHARLLATAIGDEVAQETLRGYADELDQLIKELEARMALMKQPSPLSESDQNTAAPAPPAKPDKG
jgi:hypothetical protein